MPRSLLRRSIGVWALALLATTLLMLSCRNDTEGEQGKGGGAGPGTTVGKPNNNWIYGEWSGNFENKEGEESSALRETTAKAVFTPTDADARAGDFVFEFPLLDQVAVKGSFQDFRDSLMLTITESNFSALGVAGSSTTMNYTLAGRSLEIYNKKITIRLISKTALRQREADVDSPAAADTLVGLWGCTDRLGRSWRINVSDPKHFALRVSAVDRASLWARGSIETGSNKETLFKVEAAKSPSLQGAVLTAVMSAERAFDLTVRAESLNVDDNQGLDQFPCARID